MDDIANYVEEKELNFIYSPSDLARLNIVDWNRYRSYWKTPMRAIDVVGSYFVGFRYAVWSVNLHQHPDRDDFPEWNHVGGQHRDLGELFWNFFKDMFDGEVRFHDKPDLSGHIYHPDLTPQKRVFWGDIGKISPIVMMDTARFLHYPDMWISVLDEYTLVILEAPPWTALDSESGVK